MAFTRKFLLEQGVPEEKIDTILAERNRSMGDYILKSEADENLKKALEEQKPVQIDVKATEEYKALENKISMYSAFDTAEFEVIKKPYREMIWDKLDHSEKHAEYAEQLGGLAEKYPDMFNAPVPPEDEDKKPQFGSDTAGSIPNGDKAESFGDYWGYKKKQ